MAITTTGSSADGYETVANADSYATDHFIGDDLTTWNGATTAEKEAAIRQATQYIDSYFRHRFIGVIRSTSQALEWPRSGAVDQAGRVVNDIPDVVKNATVELAKERLVDGNNLQNVQDRGGKIKREKVGPLETEYLDGAPAHKQYKFAENLLSLVLDSSPGRLVRT